MMKLIMTLLVVLIHGMGISVALAAESEARPAKNPFFAFDNGAGRGELPPEQQARLLAELGYAGIGYTGTQGIPEMLAALDAHGLKMFSTYVRADVGPDRASYDSGMKEAIRQLKGRDTILWLYLIGRDGNDAQAVRVVREVADLALPAGLRVALYPHVGFYVATVDDALRVAKKADRENVGVSFNLCHFLKLDNEKNIESTLKRAMPHLYLVSINGADAGRTNAMGWDRLIQTLDRGAFDMAGFLKTLDRLGYTGPIGLQCYNIPGDRRDNLRRSMEAWRSYQEHQ